MTFFTDMQTKRDLNLIDRYSNRSVYAIFNQVKTLGASRLLEKMFNNPLIDHEAINARSSIFKFFGRLDIEFPLDDEELLIVETYLQTGGINSLAGFCNTMRIITLRLIGVAEEFDLRTRQILTTIRFCDQMKRFIHQILVASESNPIADELKTAYEFLDTLTEVNWQQKRAEIPIAKLFAYDHRFRVQDYPKLRNLIALTHRLDLYIAVSSLSRKNNYTYAEAVGAEHNLLSMVNCRNPLVKFAKGNPVEMNDVKNLLFLTGANMAGKSTFMKSVGIALYLAHMGFPVPADSMKFSVKDGLFTSINISDNLEQGHSHFYAEVRRVKDVADVVGGSKKLFIIFDELFKGTNVKDAYDATLAVTRAFARYKQCGFIISTHIIEVTRELKESQENIQFYYLPTEMNNKIPIYTYNLTEGVSDDRHGMLLIQREGIIDLLQ